MKKISRYRRKLLLKKLSSLNVFVLVTIHIGLPLIFVAIGQVIVRIQLQSFKVADNPIDYQYRTILLCLILSGLLIGILDVLFLLNPIITLERTVDEYGETVSLPEGDAYQKYFITSSLEIMFMDMLKVQKQNIEKQYKAELLRQETELVALQSQINPHFLYNTLDSIRGLALIHGVDQIADMTEALSNLFRNMIAKEGKMITLKEEFDNINNYMTIQQFRFQNKFIFHKEIEDQMLQQYLVPNLTLQPVVENAIMHGLERKREGGDIFVRAYCTKKRLILSVRDNGVGIEERQLKEMNQILHKSDRIEGKGNGRSTGIALYNINQRIRLQFGQEYGLRIMSTPRVYTNVEIILPLMVYDEEGRGEIIYEK